MFTSLSGLYVNRCEFLPGSLRLTEEDGNSYMEFSVCGRTATDPYDPGVNILAYRTRHFLLCELRRWRTDTAVFHTRRNGGALLFCGEYISRFDAQSVSAKNGGAVTRDRDYGIMPALLSESRG